MRCVSTISPPVVSARHLYRATAELGEATQLCVFILGTGTFTSVYLGVFGYGCAVCVLVAHWQLSGNAKNNLGIDRTINAASGT